MRLEILRTALRIVPEDTQRDEKDTAYIEKVLGLENDGDSVQLRRHNAYGLFCIAYIEAKKMEE